MEKKFLDKKGLAELFKSFKDKFVSQDEFNQKEQEIYSNTSSELTGAFGTLSSQMQNKASKSDVPTKLSQLKEDETHKVVTQEEKDNWSNKVDKVNGKDLSTNDYTNSDKAKVNAIPSNPKYTDTVTRINGKTGDITKEDLETLDVWVSEKYLYKILFGEYLLTREAGKWAVVHGQPTEIESGTFQHKNLISVYIPNCVKWIGRASFTNNKLTNVTIPESVVHIGSLAFTENPLKEVKVPTNCKVANDAFDAGVNIIRY